MVDVTSKSESDRRAVARGRVMVKPSTLTMVRDQLSGVDTTFRKGDVLGVARLAGIMAAKRTGELIPLCHPLNLTAVSVDFTVGEDCVEVEAEAKINDRTGVEMEAMVAASTALMTIYDMCKGVDRGMVIGRLRLMEKRGGRSGTWLRDEG